MPKPIWNDGDYWYRRRVPADIRATYGKGEEWEALHTSDRAEAKRRLPDAMKAVEALFDAHRRTLGTNGSGPAAALNGKPLVAVAGSGDAFYSVREAVEFYKHGIDEIECQKRAEDTARTLADPEALWRGEIIKLAPNVKREMGVGSALAACYRDRMARRLAAFVDAMEIMDLRIAKLLVRSVFPECDNSQLMIECARAEIEYMEDKLRRPGSVAYDLPPDEKQEPLEASDEVPLLSVVAAKWRLIKVREGWTDARMLPLLDTSVALLIEVCSDKPLSAYGKSHVTEFKDVLSRLPRHRSKNPKTRNLTAREAAALGLPPIDLKTANDYLRTITKLFDWAKLSFDGVDNNPFKDATFTNKTDQRNEKDPFSSSELQAIFLAIKRADDAKFWAPILGLYTGCRSNEILKLKVSDVRQDDEAGVWYLDANEDHHETVYQVAGEEVRVHHTLKRPSHKRCIPIPSDLVAFGFLEFVDPCKNERVFSERMPSKAGKFSDAYGKWFRRFLDEIGVKRPKVDFHSFRHNFVDACDSRMPDDIIKRLKGDARGGTLDRYGKGKTEVQLLAEHLKNMRAPRIIALPATSAALARAAQIRFCDGHGI